MKYKVGDQVVVEVEVQKNGTKRIVNREALPDSKIIEKIFPIAAFDETDQSYKIIVDEDIVGWTVSQFHIKHMKVNEKYLNKKFYDLAEQFIVRKK
jgi:hypothetical protein